MGIKVLSLFDGISGCHGKYNNALEETYFHFINEYTVED